MFEFDPQTLEDFKAHAMGDFPRESVGLVVLVDGAQRYMRGQNTADEGEKLFRLAPEDYAAAEDAGEILCIAHSHPNGVAIPSHVDRMGCEFSRHPWAVLALGGDPLHCGQHTVFEPCGWEPPLVEREFHYGILDCYTLVRDWYQREWNITLPEFDHGPDLWWDKKSPNHRPGFSPYLQHFTEAGFEPAGGQMQTGDIIIMQIKADEPNHAAVYLGDGVMLHHLYNRLSERTIYGGYWADVTRKVVRLKSR